MERLLVWGIVASGISAWYLYKKAYPPKPLGAGFGYDMPGEGDD